jgi:hypothetical protein
MCKSKLNFFISPVSKVGVSLHDKEFIVKNGQKCCFESEGARVGKAPKDSPAEKGFTFMEMDL